MLHDVTLGKPVLTDLDHKLTPVHLASRWWVRSLPMVFEDLDELLFALGCHVQSWILGMRSALHIGFEDVLELWHCQL